MKTKVIQKTKFIMHVEGNRQSPDTFPGSETGTEVTWGPTELLKDYLAL